MARLSCFVAQLAAGLGWWIVSMVLLAVLAALCDWAFVLRQEQRETLQYVAAGVAGLLLVPVLWAAVCTVLRLPDELDELNEDPRRTISCALRLPTQHSSALGEWLASCAREQAAVAVCRARRHFPALKRWLVAIMAPALTAAGVIGLYSAFPDAFGTLSARLLTPWEDIPPYSSLRFIPEEKEWSVHYGEDLSVGCIIKGDETVGDICLLVKSEGMPVQKLPAFRMGDERFVRVLENVTAPCTVAFATTDGRARSHFWPVVVNLSPRILSGKATVTPLPYTGEQAREIKLGGSEILVPDGGSVSIELVCSVQIEKGYAYFEPAGEEERKLIELAVQENRLSLNMPVRQPGTLSMQVVDACGREAEQPVRIRLGVLPDVPPSVTITHPEPDAWLVAGHPLALEVKAEDDYALSRFVLYKALAPYRQHGISELQGKSRTQVLVRSYDTAALGLSPGDKLELRAEVGDENPFRFNIVSTPTTIVHVISEEEYAAVLRMELGYEEFLVRYEELEEALLNISQMLKNEEFAALPEALDKALKLARTFETDFPAFDMDGELSTTAGEIAAKLENALQLVGNLPPDADAESRKALARKIQELLGEGAGELERQREEAQVVALMARVSEAQGKFMQLVEQQARLVGLFQRFMQEYGAASTSEPHRLEGLGAEQAAIMQEYVAWMEGLSELLAELTRQDELAELYQLISSMRYACEQAGVEGLMDQAVDEAVALHPAEAHSYAIQALEAMRKLLQNECSEGNCKQAVNQCRNGLSMAAQKTLQQLLDSMSGRFGASSNGVGLSGGTSSLPTAGGGRLMGPARSRMGRGGRRSGNAKAEGGQAPGRDVTAPGERQRIGTPDEHSVSYPDAVPEQVPAPYRDAVRSYFSY